MMPDKIRLEIPDGEDASILDRLAAEDVLGQLLRREGRMRELGAEGGDVKLDWVDGVEKALAHPEWLAAVEHEAADLLRAGIRHVVWAGMGGSVQTVYALRRLGFFDENRLSVHPLDSTDPAALNALLVELALLEGVEPRALDPAAFRGVLERTAMIGVSMGMTSEEPITHLEWFDGLLRDLGVDGASAHIQVMTLPDSYLDRFARPRGSRMVPIQLDAQNHTPGRMSAPATRVFLRPVALRLMADLLAASPDATADGTRLAAVLGRCQALSGLAHGLDAAGRAELSRRDPFVRLGAYLAAAAGVGRNQLLPLLPAGWEGVAPWLEQLVEESLGKGGKGLLVFYGQDPESLAGLGDGVVPLEIRLGSPEHPVAASLRRAGRPVLTLDVPLARLPDVPDGLGELAALCLGFERMVAVFGYLQGIVFAGQPAVEAYKRYARDLREAPGPVGFPADSPYQAGFRGLTLYYQSPIVAKLLAPEEVSGEARRLGADPGDAAGVLAAIISLSRRAGRLSYLDFTFNGEFDAPARAVFEAGRRRLANHRLRIPGKLRTGPSDYHSTEQSETDGPPELVSVRFVALEHEPALVGRYSDKFLLAQARGTWQAMEDARRSVLLVALPKLDDVALDDLSRLFRGVDRLLAIGYHS